MSEIRHSIRVVEGRVVHIGVWVERETGRMLGEEGRSGDGAGTR